jgi:hypothetical protein
VRFGYRGGPTTIFKLKEAINVDIFLYNSLNTNKFSQGKAKDVRIPLVV